MAQLDSRFYGSIPQIYEYFLVPLIFQPYADDLAARVVQCEPLDILEIAAGTGVLTRALARALPPPTTIIATDLSQSMLDQAKEVGTTYPVTWRLADSALLPFPDASFDVVACQFGVMFFSDRAKSYAEARRVLKPSGQFIFNVWDRLRENEFADIVTQALDDIFPRNPPRFLARTPYGYYNTSTILHDLSRGGFKRTPELVTLSACSRADSPAFPALAYCQGTPLRNEIESQGSIGLAEATQAATKALARQFGYTAVFGKIQAHIIAVHF
jgi:SAM-dependent methyltransferase